MVIESVEQPSATTVGYEVPSGVSKIVFLGAGGVGQYSQGGLQGKYVGGTIPRNEGNFIDRIQTPILVLGDTQNFAITWGFPPNNNAGVFDNKVYVFAPSGPTGASAWSSITLLLI